ncbi:hypothetical protein BZA05DRAFT_477275, partial [Tricharina praecox]|uniref:uncharacterized protein n=1 Tax=Tricharina praecox TaxID=43433 RepID=UPI00221F5D9D
MKSFQITISSLLTCLILGVNASPAAEGAGLAKREDTSFGCPYVSEACNAICMSQVDANGDVAYKGECHPTFWGAFNCVCLYTTVDDDGTPVLGAATRTVIARPP